MGEYRRVSGAAESPVAAAAAVASKSVDCKAETKTPLQEVAIQVCPGESGVSLKRTEAGRRSKPSGAKVLDPAGCWYHRWSLVVSLAFLYNFWSLSYRFAFREIGDDTVAFWFALDYSADLIYLLDVVVSFHTGYLEDGVLQRSSEKIGQHYRESTQFYVDCFCLLPLDILYLSIGYNSILRCTRLVKIYKFWGYVDRTERHTNYPNVFRTFTLVHYILVIFHWNACLFHMISRNKIFDIENLYRINDNRCDDIPCQYLHAFYWSTLALTAIGDLPRPRTKGEYFYVTCELLFGLFLFASVLGHVANIVTNVSAARKEFQAKLDAVKTFMRMRRVSDELQTKVIRWFDYLWISQKSSDEERSVACLPDRLKAEIAIHVHLDTLKRVDIFQNTEAGFLCELVLRLKPVLFSPGDYVCRKNEVGHEMYIVSRGILEVVTDQGKTVVATLKAGSYFGEISVLNVGLAGNKRTASVRSVGYSDLFCLNKQDLWDVLKNYPAAEARIRARAEERLSKLDMPSSQPPLPLPLPLQAPLNASRSRLYSSSSRRPSARQHLSKAPPCCQEWAASLGPAPRNTTRHNQPHIRGAHHHHHRHHQLPPPTCACCRLSVSEMPLALGAQSYAMQARHHRHLGSSLRLSRDIERSLLAPLPPSSLAAADCSRSLDMPRTRTRARARAVLRPSSKTHTSLLGVDDNFESEGAESVDSSPSQGSGEQNQEPPLGTARGHHWRSPNTTKSADDEPSKGNGDGEPISRHEETSDDGQVEEQAGDNSNTNGGAKSNDATYVAATGQQPLGRGPIREWTAACQHQHRHHMSHAEDLYRHQQLIGHSQHRHRHRHRHRYHQHLVPCCEAIMAPEEATSSLWWPRADYGEPELLRQEQLRARHHELGGDESGQAPAGWWPPSPLAAGTCSGQLVSHLRVPQRSAAAATTDDEGQLVASSRRRHDSSHVHHQHHPTSAIGQLQLPSQLTRSSQSVGLRVADQVPTVETTSRRPHPPLQLSGQQHQVAVQESTCATPTLPPPNSSWPPPPSSGRQEFGENEEAGRRQ